MKRQLTALVMAVVMILTSLPLGSLQAGMVSTQQILDENLSPSTEAESVSDRAKVQAFFARDDVRAEMVGLGITPAEADARVAGMTDQEIADLAGRLDDLPAGGLGLGTILIFMFVAFGVAVMMDALGIINIFPFVCGPGQCSGQQAQAAYPEPAAAPADEYIYDERRPVYREDRYDRRRYRDHDDRAYESNSYYEPERPASRNYFDERVGNRQFR
jgi:hypothetical protein